MAKWCSPCAKDMITWPFANMIAQLFATTILHHYQIFVYFVHMLWQLTPWPLDNHKVATCISSVHHVVSLPHGCVVKTTCMSQIFWLNHVLIIKLKFTNLQNIMFIHKLLCLLQPSNGWQQYYVICYICALLCLLQPSNGWQQYYVI
jgi:hypothetical protein